MKLMMTRAIMIKMNEDKLAREDDLLFSLLLMLVEWIRSVDWLDTWLDTKCPLLSLAVAAVLHAPVVIMCSSAVAVAVAVDGTSKFLAKLTCVCKRGDVSRDWPSFTSALELWWPWLKRFVYVIRTGKCDWNKFVRVYGDELTLIKHSRGRRFPPPLRLSRGNAVQLIAFTWLDASDWYLLNDDEDRGNNSCDNRCCCCFCRCCCWHWNVLLARSWNGEQLPAIILSRDE